MNAYLIEILITFILTTSLPSNIIGTNIKDLSYQTEIDENFSQELNRYVIKENLLFLGHAYNRLSIITDKEHIIKYYKITINEFDRKLFDLMVEKYGEPSYIGKQGAKVYDSINSYNENGIKIEKFTTKSIPCTFDENPTTISWDKSKINVQIIKTKNNFYDRIKITFGKQ